MDADIRRRGNGPRAPWWFVVMLVVMVLPAASSYAVVSGLPGNLTELSTLFKLFPLYIAAAAFFAWLCYAERRMVSWILVGIILLSYLAEAMIAVELT